MILVHVLRSAFHRRHVQKKSPPGKTKNKTTKLRKSTTNKSNKNTHKTTQQNTQQHQKSNNKKRSPEGAPVQPPTDNQAAVSRWGLAGVERQETRGKTQEARGTRQDETTDEKQERPRPEKARGT